MNVSRIRGAWHAFHVARSFGLTKPQAAYRALRFLFTGRTGYYSLGTRSQRMRAAGFTRRPSRKAAGGLMREESE